MLRIVPTYAVSTTKSKTFQYKKKTNFKTFNTKVIIIHIVILNGYFIIHCNINHTSFGYRLYSYDDTAERYYFIGILLKV